MIGVEQAPADIDNQYKSIASMVRYQWIYASVAQTYASVAQYIFADRLRQNIDSKRNTLFNSMHVHPIDIIK